MYYFNAYKLFPYFKNIDSDFMKLKVDIVQKILGITLFLVQLESILSKLGLKKARKATQFSKR